MTGWIRRDSSITNAVTYAEDNNILKSSSKGSQVLMREFTDHI